MKYLENNQRRTRLLQIYNVEEGPRDLAPSWLSPLLSPSNINTTRQLERELDELELKLDELEGPLLIYMMKP